MTRTKRSRRLVIRHLIAGASLLTACVAGVSEETRTRSRNEYELAVSIYRDEHNPRGALAALERAIRLDPDNAEAHLLLGQLFGESGMYDRAAPSLRRAVEIFLREVVDDPEKFARLGEARNSLAAALINLGRPQEALDILRPVTEDVHYPNQHLAMANTGQALIALHRYPAAIVALQRAVAIRPDFCLGHYRLGEAYAGSNDLAHALPALDRALSSPGNGCDRIQPAFRLRGEVHARLHQPDAARADFTRCRDLGPDSRDGRDCASQLRTAEAP